jgi:multidrug resistance protein, MATE family
MSGPINNLNSQNSIKDLFLFSLPIIFGQLGMMLITVADVFVASKHSTVSAASLGVALGFINPVFLLGIGLLQGIAPILSIKRGRGEEPTQYLWTSIIYALLISVIMIALMLLVNLLIPHTGIEEELIPFVQRYTFISAWSFPFAYIFQAIKEYLQAFEKVIMANIVAAIAVVVNILLNYLFVFGMWGFPEIGYDGLAYASFGVRVFLAMTLLLAVFGTFKSWKIDWDYMLRTFKFSLPISLMMFLEVMAFCSVSIVVGTLNVNQAAANNVVLQLASLSFMIPLSISAATSVKIGIQYGRQSFAGVMEVTKSSLFLSLPFMLMSCLTYILFPESLMKLMSEDGEVQQIGVALLLIVGVFQLIDGIQVVLAGVLRGIEKTKESFVSIMIGYWVLGIPIGLLLTFFFKMQAQGMWLGLATALLIVGIALSAITYKQFQLLKDKFQINP